MTPWNGTPPNPLLIYTYSLDTPGEEVNTLLILRPSSLGLARTETDVSRVKPTNEFCPIT